MSKKLSSCLFFVLVVAFPFEHFRLKFLCSFSHFLYERFQETVAFSVKIPSFISTKIHIYLSDILILVLLLLSLKNLRIKEVLKDSRMRCLLIFFVLCLLSIFCSSYRSYFYLYISTLHLFFGFLLFFFCVYSLKGRTHFLTIIFNGVVCVAVFQAIVAILQFLTQHSLGLRCLGEPLLEISRGVAVIPMPEKGKWLIELFSSLPKGHQYLYRSVGTFPHANILGGYFVFSLIVTHFLFTEAKTSWKRKIFGLCIFLQIFALFLTFSRAGIFSYLLASIIWFSFPLFKNGRKKRCVSLAVTIIFSLIVSIGGLFSYLETRGGFFNYNSFVKYSDHGRLANQQITAHMIKEHPLIGVGYNCFTFAKLDNLPSELAKLRDRPHNIYLLVAGETGLLGLCAFLFFLFSLGSLFFRPISNPYFQTFFSIFSAFLFIGLCDLYFFTTQVGKLLFFLTGGLVAATAVEVAEPIRNALFTKNKYS